MRRLYSNLLIKKQQKTEINLRNPFEYRNHFVFGTD